MGKAITVQPKSNNGKIVQYRYFGKDGYVIKDLDLTNHGNSKHHQLVPHKHLWIKINTKSDKIELRRGPATELDENDLADLERWAQDEQD